MKIGLLSDTHGRYRITRRALTLLEEAGAASFIHCGDVGDERVLDELAGRQAWFVWGNTDLAVPYMIRYVETIGLTPPGDVPLRLALGGRRIDVYHGHEAPFSRLMRAIEAGDTARVAALAAGVDYVVFGHTHRRLDQRVGSLRLINPGALHRARPPSVALLDTGSGELTYYEVEA